MADEPNVDVRRGEVRAPGRRRDAALGVATASSIRYGLAIAARPELQRPRALLDEEGRARRQGLSAQLLPERPHRIEAGGAGGGDPGGEQQAATITSRLAT